MKDYLTNFVLWLAAACSLLLLLYFLTSPLIFLNTNKGPTASPLLLKLSGPVVYVLESDFKGPMLWYFGLWGIGIDYFARDPVPGPPWYVAPAYTLLGLGSFAALAYPFSKQRLKKCAYRAEPNDSANDEERVQTCSASERR